MKTRIHSIRLIFLLMLTLGYTQANSQEYYQENPKAISLFNRLNKMFPRRYLTHTNLQYAFYHLEYYFKDSKDYEKYQAPINDIIKEMKDIKTTRFMSDITDSADVVSQKYTLSIPSTLIGQTDKLHLTYDRKKIIFHYESSNDIIRQKRYAAQNPNITSEAEALLKQYIKRQGVKEQPVAYYNNVRYIRSVWDININRHYGSPAILTKGTKYIVPNCTQKDFDLFRNQFRKYIKKDHCYLIENDVYWQFEESCLHLIQPDGRSLSFCAALRGTDLYLLRVEDTAKNKGIVPRAWALDDPIWDANKHHDFKTR